MVHQRQRVFLLGRPIVRPEHEDAGIERPVKLQGDRRQFAEAVMLSQPRDDL